MAKNVFSSSNAKCKDKPSPDICKICKFSPIVETAEKWVRWVCKYLRWLVTHSIVKCCQGDNVEEEFGDGMCAVTQKRLWNLFENPHYSSAAKVRIVINLKS